MYTFLVIPSLVFVKWNQNRPGSICESVGESLGFRSRGVIEADIGAATRGAGQVIKIDGKINARELGTTKLVRAVPRGVVTYSPKWLSQSMMKSFKYLNY